MKTKAYKMIFQKLRDLEKSGLLLTSAKVIESEIVREIYLANLRKQQKEIFLLLPSTARNICNVIGNRKGAEQNIINITAQLGHLKKKGLIAYSRGVWHRIF